mmetsp:Transcript_4499/g.8552  ORF Transcript_4499/g.8552 Transcript_4499/m.8552 type:complete len:170 (+) Transcript_4499:37-546(+)
MTEVDTTPAAEVKVDAADAKKEEETPAPVESFSRDVGVIVPPPDIKLVVDRTADFVRKVGPKFEATIQQRNKNSKKFGFLVASSPYYAYYQQRLKFGDAVPEATEAAEALPDFHKQSEADAKMEEVKVVKEAEPEEKKAKKEESPCSCADLKRAPASSHSQCENSSEQR